MPKAKRKAVSKRKSPAKDEDVAKSKVTGSSENTPKRRTRTKKVDHVLEDNPPLNITVKIAKTGRQPAFYFWTDPNSEGGFLSPWYLCPFKYGGTVYNCAGQYILAAKAEFANDMESREKILLATTEDELKTLGDNIKNMPIEKWINDRYYMHFLETANRRKFLYSEQSQDLLEKFAKLGNRELVFCDPTDPYLGVGLSASEAETVGRESWGRNDYGKSFKALRHKIRHPISPVLKDTTWPCDTG
ncbi:hypothetical protein DM02DRAFT_124923 [Periconia macrospinosa]|uniref:NADAR domain-containing protein n=1 Tax=Periconia macrospinosa TaxID=97972 RepID=A0A2V1DDW9_9PLEO|nr:hypothetical protein DM02DRAFT_124923 [Periconia macrospinosa]